MKKQSPKSDTKHEKMVHVRLDQELHRRLRVYVATRDLSIQEWVASIIAREVANDGSQLSSSNGGSQS
jgi:predicted HicB family RNase H-like nuclease